MSQNKMRDLTATEREALMQSIRTAGIQVPIAVLPDGAIIDGFQRKACADLLGIDCPQIVYDVDDKTAARLAVDLNRARRQLSEKEMSAYMVELCNEGMTQRQIAATTGISQPTAHRRLIQAESNDGEPPRRRKYFKPSATERVRLREYCITQWRAGYTTRSIAAALDITAGPVRSYLGEEAAGSKRYKEPSEPLAPFYWRDTEAQVLKRKHHRDDKRRPSIEPPTPYKVSTTLALIRSMLMELRNDNAENRFANDVADAVAANDTDWIAHAHQGITDLHTYLVRIEGVLADKANRDRAIRDWSRRDDMAPVLHLVAGTTP